MLEFPSNGGAHHRGVAVLTSPGLLDGVSTLEMVKDRVDSGHDSRQEYQYW